MSNLKKTEDVLTDKQIEVLIGVIKTRPALLEKLIKDLVPSSSEKKTTPRKRVRIDPVLTHDDEMCTGDDHDDGENENDGSDENEESGNNTSDTGSDLSISLSETVQDRKDANLSVTSNISEVMENTFEMVKNGKRDRRGNRKNQKAENSNKIEDKPVQENAVPGANTNRDLTTTVYINGKQRNFVEFVSVNWNDFVSEFKNNFKPPSQFQMAGRCVKVVCSDEQQTTELLKCTNFLGEPVRCSIPYSLERRLKKNDLIKTEKKFVLKGVPIFWPEEIIKTETQANFVRRINSYKTGSKMPTTVVIIAFESDPKEVVINHLHFKTSAYIPKPGRCTNCQKFGHKMENCHHQKCCVKCSGTDHDYQTCPALQNPDLYKCRNCGEKHSAAFKGCRKYREIEKVLKISVNKDKSFAEARKQLKRNKQRASEKADEKRNDRRTSTPVQEKCSEHELSADTQRSQFFENTKLTPLQVTPDANIAPSRIKKTGNSLKDIVPICSQLVYHLTIIAEEIKYSKVKKLKALALRINQLGEVIQGENFVRSVVCKSINEVEKKQ